MSRTPKRGKSPGYDYWQRRPGNESHCNAPGKGVKRRTHKAERQDGKGETKKP